MESQYFKSNFIYQLILKMWQRMFGRKKQKPKPTITDVVLNLQRTIDLMHKKQKFLKTKIDRELRNAKENLKTNKRVAILAMKKKKMYESQLSKIDGTILNLEMQKIAIESSVMDIEILSTMKQGSETLKEMNDWMNIDDVEDVMADIQEQMEVQNEVSTAISQPMLGSELFDSDIVELEKELQGLLDEDLGVSISAMPNAPQHEKNDDKNQKDVNLIYQNSEKKVLTSDVFQLNY